MRRILAILCLAMVSGCGVWSTTMRSEIADYSDVVEQTADQFLLINILEARDDAPLHFAAIPSIHGSLQATASVGGSFPYKLGTEGTPTPATALLAATPVTAFINGTATPSIGVQSSPTFEVDSVDTKEFATGISSPIDPKFIKYWVDRGIDKRIILLLFFSSAEIIDTKYNPCAVAALKTRFDSQCRRKTPFANGAVITIHNNPRDAANKIYMCEHSDEADVPSVCHSRTDFELYLKLIDALNGTIAANSYSQRTLIEHDEALDIKDAAAIDPTKYEVERERDGKFDLYSVPLVPSYALCVDGKFDVLSGWTAALQPQPDPPIVHVVKDKKGHTSRIAESPPAAAGDRCSDAVVTTSPTDPAVVLPGAQDFLLPATSPARPYLDQPCSEGTKPRPVYPAPWGDPSRPFCSMYLNFMATRDGRGYPGDQYRILLNPRSVSEMIRYLGDIVYYQDKLGPRTNDPHHNVPVTLGYYWDCHHDAGSNIITGKNCTQPDGGLLFNLVHGGEPGRVNVNYRGESYSIAEHTPDDHTLEVLSIVNQLVNLNKSASDLRSTPTVQIIP